MTATDLPQGMAENVIPLSFGHPDPETLPVLELREAMLRLMNGPRAGLALQYGTEQGTQSLIEVLVEKLNREQDLALQSANLMIVAGSTHAVDMLTRLYAKPGGVVLIEAPTYADSLHVLRDHRVELCSIPMDEEGLIPDALAEQIDHLHARGTFPSMLYTIPTFHNPTGRTLTEQRRRAVIELARRHGFWIVEDDVYRDLAFAEKAPPSFYALAGGKQVLSIGSFSKTLSPGLRLGWLVAPEEEIQHCVACGTTQMGGGANPLVAHMVAEYCRSGAWEPHVQRLRSLYKTRRDVAISALERFMPTDVEWTHPAGGFFLWLRLPEYAQAQEIKRLALQQGVTLTAGEGFFVEPADGMHYLRLAYSCASPEQIEAGIHILAQIIRERR
jgi:2-aminoadipate transaminase